MILNPDLSLQEVNENIRVEFQKAANDRKHVLHVFQLPLMI